MCLSLRERERENFDRRGDGEVGDAQNRLPTTKEQAVHPPVLDLRVGFPRRSTEPSWA